MIKTAKTAGIAAPTAKGTEYAESLHEKYGAIV